MKYSKLVFILLLCLYLAGCSKDTVTDPVTESKDSGKMLLKFNKTETPPNVVLVTAALTRQGFNPITGTLNIITDTSAELTLSNIAAGLWHLKIEAKDSQGNVLYRGESDVNILAGIVNQVNLVLQPTGSSVGSIYIIVSWSGNQVTSKWGAQQSNTTEHLQSVFFLNQNIGWVTGAGGVILKTTDAGKTWNSQKSGTIQRINSVFFLDENIGWAVGDNGVILKTNTGGASWDNKSGITQSSLYSVKFYLGGTGWITGADGTIIKVQGRDGRMASKNFGYSMLLNSSFADTSCGWIVGSGGTIIKTTNGGEQWNDAGSSGGWQWLQAVYFSDINTGVAVGGSGSIIKTTNGGKTWYMLSNVTSEHLEDLSFINYNTGWAVGDHGTVLKTTNGGNTWASERTPVNTWLNAVFFCNDTCGWAVGNYGTIIKYNK